VGELIQFRKVAAEGFLFHAGEPCTGFFVVLEGQIRLVRTTEQGAETTLHVVRPGQSFAEAALFSGAAFPASAVAMEDTLLAQVPRAPFLALLRADPDLCLKMLESLAAWHHRLTFQVQQLSAQDSGTRLRRWIADAARESRDGVIRLRVSKKVLAGQLGMAPETLSRHLRALMNAGALVVTGNAIRVLGELEDSK
jgi:CRP/FNR family transcriptional regulator